MLMYIDITEYSKANVCFQFTIAWKSSYRPNYKLSDKSSKRHFLLSKSNT